MGRLQVWPSSALVNIPQPGVARRRVLSRVSRGGALALKKGIAGCPLLSGRFFASRGDQAGSSVLFRYLTLGDRFFKILFGTRLVLLGNAIRTVFAVRSPHGVQNPSGKS